MKKAFIKWYKKSKLLLPDSFIMQFSEFRGIGAKNIPKELIEVKRKLIVLKRTIKKYEKL